MPAACFRVELPTPPVAHGTRLVVVDADDDRTFWMGSGAAVPLGWFELNDVQAKLAAASAAAGTERDKLSAAAAALRALHDLLPPGPNETP
jgi:hypothetical protein